MCIDILSTDSQVGVIENRVLGERWRVGSDAMVKAGLLVERVRGSRAESERKRKNKKQEAPVKIELGAFFVMTTHSEAFSR